MPERMVEESSSVDSSSKSLGVGKRKTYIESLLEDLVRILDIELEQYRNLMDMLRTQRKQFATGDIGSFEEIGKQQETVILKIKTLEEARKSIVSQLAQCFSVNQEQFTLTKLEELVDDHYSERCSVLRKEILSIIRNLENLRESNAYLIQHALHYVSGVLKIFASSQNNNYSNTGKIEEKQESGKYISGWG